MMRPIYIYRPLLNGADLALFAEMAGMRNVIPPSDMHVTVAYSRTPVDWDRPEFQPIPRLAYAFDPPSARALVNFGDVVVLEFHLPELHTRFNELRGAGAAWGYPTYRSHVTLAADPDFDPSGMVSPGMPLFLDGETREEPNVAFEY